MGHRHRVHRRQIRLGVLQQAPDHGQQGAAVGQAAALVRQAQQPVIPAQGSGGSRRRGFNPQYQQISTPSTVISRAPEPVFSSRTRISVPSKASGTFSLHSTAHTPPRAR